MRSTTKVTVRLAAIAPLAVLVGCTSSVAGKAASTSTAATSPSTTADSTPTSPTSSAPTSSAQTSAPPTSASGFPTTVSGLGAFLQSGTRSLKYAHLKLVEDAGTVNISGAGDEVLSDGKAVAIDITETVSGAGKVRSRIVDGRVFAQLPAALVKATKPWVELTANASTATLRQLYATFQSSLQSGATSSIQSFVSAAKGLTQRGTQTLDGVTVERYSLTIDVASLPANFPNKAALGQSGLKNIPLELYVDKQGRTRKVTESFTIGGQHVTSDVELSKLDVPVTIKAPPADQIQKG